MRLLTLLLLLMLTWLTLLPAFSQKLLHVCFDHVERTHCRDFLMPYTDFVAVALAVAAAAYFSAMSAPIAPRPCS